MCIKRDGNKETIMVKVGFTFPRQKFDDMFRDKLKYQGLKVRNLTDSECDDLKMEMHKYFETQIYSLFWEHLESQGYVDEFIEENLS